MYWVSSSVLSILVQYFSFFDMYIFEDKTQFAQFTACCNFMHDFNRISKYVLLKSSNIINFKCIIYCKNYLLPPRDVDKLVGMVKEKVVNNVHTITNLS